MATPLYTFDYYGSRIETYSTYSIVDGQVSTNMLYYVKSGNLIVVDRGMDPIADGLFAYYSEGESYIGVLCADGSIVSMGSVNLPASLSGFKNEEIASLASNISSDSSSLVVTYVNGSTVGYDVLTGQEIFRTGATEKQSIGEYLTDYIEGMFNSITDKTFSSGRKTADNLINKLEQYNYNFEKLDAEGFLDNPDALAMFVEGGITNGEAVIGEGISAEVYDQLPGDVKQEYEYNQQTGAYVKISDLTYEYDTNVYDSPTATDEKNMEGDVWVLDTTKTYGEQKNGNTEEGESRANGYNDIPGTGGGTGSGGKTEIDVEGKFSEQGDGAPEGSEGSGGPQTQSGEKTGKTDKDAKDKTQSGDSRVSATEITGEGTGSGTDEEALLNSEGGTDAERIDRSESIMQNSDREEFVAVFNPETDSYDIYSVSELMENPEAAESETAKINGANNEALTKMLSATEDHVQDRGFNMYSIIIGIVLVLFVVAGFALKRARKEVHYDDDDGYITK